MFFLRLVVVFLFTAQWAMALEDKYPVLRAGDETYTNVTVTSISAKSIFITHSQGMATVKLSDLDPEIRAKYQARADHKAEADQRTQKHNAAFVQAQTQRQQQQKQAAKTPAAATTPATAPSKSASAAPAAVPSTRSIGMVPRSTPPQTVKNGELQYSLTTPAGFFTSPEIKQKVGKEISKMGSFFAKPKLADCSIKVLDPRTFFAMMTLDLNAEYAPAELAEKMPKVPTAPGSKTSSVSDANWKSTPIKILRVEGSSGGLNFVEFDTGLPLKPKAIMLAVTGPADRESETRQYFDDILNSLEGEVSAKTPSKFGFNTSGDFWWRVGRRALWGALIGAGVGILRWLIKR